MKTRHRCEMTQTHLRKSVPNTARQSRFVPRHHAQHEGWARLTGALQHPRSHFLPEVVPSSQPPVQSSAIRRRTQRLKPMPSLYEAFGLVMGLGVEFPSVLRRRGRAHENNAHREGTRFGQVMTRQGHSISLVVLSHPSPEPIVSQGPGQHETTHHVPPMDGCRLKIRPPCPNGQRPKKNSPQRCTGPIDGPPRRTPLQHQRTTQHHGPRASRWPCLQSRPKPRAAGRRQQTATGHRNQTSGPVHAPNEEKLNRPRDLERPSFCR